MTQAWMVLQDFTKDFKTATEAARAIGVSYHTLKDCLRRQGATMQKKTINRIRTVQPHLAAELDQCVYDPKLRVYKVACHPDACPHFHTCQRLQSDGEPVLCEKV